MITLMILTYLRFSILLLTTSSLIQMQFYLQCVRPSLGSAIPCGKAGSLSKIFVDEICAIT